VCLQLSHTVFLVFGDGYSSAPDACVVDPLEVREGACCKTPTTSVPLPKALSCLSSETLPVQGKRHYFSSLTIRSARSFSITWGPVMRSQQCLFPLHLEVGGAWKMMRAHCAQFCQFLRQRKGWEVLRVFNQGKEDLLLSCGAPLCKRSMGVLVNKIMHCLPKSLKAFHKMRAMSQFLIYK